MKGDSRNSTRPGSHGKPANQLQGNGVFSLKKYALILAILSFILYANTLKNDFVLDDFLVLKENKFVMKGVSGIGDILATPYHRGFAIVSQSNDQYRPLSLVLFAISYQIFGANAPMGHLINTLFYCACVIMLFVFTDTLFYKRKTGVAFVAAVIFAIHPIHTEVVANIKSLDELLCFFFSFSSLYILLLYHDTGRTRWLAYGVVSFFLALISKETAFTLLALVPVIFFVYRDENRRRSFYVLSAVATTAVLVLFLRYLVLHSYNADRSAVLSFVDNALAKGGLSFEQRLATAILILGYYIKLLFVPYPLICDYSFNTIPFAHLTDILVLLSLGCYVVLAFFSIGGLIKKRTDIVFATVFFLITISIFSNIFFLIGSTMAERFLFFPSAGFCIVLSSIFYKWQKENESDVAWLRRPYAFLLLGAICLTGAILTVSRNADWKDNYTLYKSDVAKAPSNCRLNFFLGTELAGNAYTKDPQTQKTMMVESVLWLQKAIDINPEYTEAHIEIGKMYYPLGRFDSTIVHEMKAIQLNPGNIEATKELGAAYLANKQYDLALRSFEAVLAKIPEDIFATYNMALTYANMKQYDKALAGLKRVLQIDEHYENGQAAKYIDRINQIVAETNSQRKNPAPGR